MKGSQQNQTNLSKMYILTQPTRLSDLSLDDLEVSDVGWRDKSRRLQMRRWRKIKQQII